MYIIVYPTFRLRRGSSPAIHGQIDFRRLPLRIKIKFQLRGVLGWAHFVTEAGAHMIQKAHGACSFLNWTGLPSHSQLLYGDPTSSRMDRDWFQFHSVCTFSGRERWHRFFLLILYQVGGFKHCLFSIIYGIILPLTNIFSRWLKPPTRYVYRVPRFHTGEFNLRKACLGTKKNGAVQNRAPHSIDWFSSA